MGEEDHIMLGQGIEDVIVCQKIREPCVALNYVINKPVAPLENTMIISSHPQQVLDIRSRQRKADVFLQRDHSLCMAPGGQAFIRLDTLRVELFDFVQIVHEEIVYAINAGMRRRTTLCVLHQGDSLLVILLHVHVPTT